MLIAGTLVVERRPKDEESEIQYEFEILSKEASSVYPYSDPKTDLSAYFTEDLMYFDDILPKEIGVYGLTVVLSIRGYQDYWGEWDIDYNEEFLDVQKLSDYDAKAYTGLETEDREDGSSEDRLG